MAMSLRVVVPPHPLIGHWLSMLRDANTPFPLYAAAMGELGRWLTYEAIREWLPHQPVSITTPSGTAEGKVVDPAVPLLAVPMLRSGLGLWQGAQTVLPSARVAHVGVSRRAPTAEADWYLDALPAPIQSRMGVLVFTSQVASGASLALVLERLRSLGVSGPRLRVITCVCASPGLRLLGESFPDLSIYTACIDAELNRHGQIVPGIGEPEKRLFDGPD
ncbi:MAG: uracil phosphoribosyltransferase [Cyanobacteriota bacterium]|jgi:uracil phosphoribosyltransferase|nr:uracil phosphoribosyltransferase [Cyanobacteriota bacterium]